ncbi:hypothetical protein RE762_004443 [Salmonella enterica]|nr:hypothetical protein [Salmonella enterica]
MENIIKTCSSLGNKVVIDCGHILIFSKDEAYSFGKTGTPSVGEIDSFRYGVKIFNLLQGLNKRVWINLYLSDLVGINGGNKERRDIYDEIENGNKEKYIPQQYIDLLKEGNVDIKYVNINLQSKGNEVFKKIIKKTYKEINSIKHIPEYHKSLYEKYNALFLTSIDNNTFSIFSPFLIDDKNENEFFDGTWWRYENISINNLWLVKLPLLRLKVNPVINLYESGGRVLCPSTYAGMVSLYDNSFDHIAVYSREDDDYIGEKIIRGVIAVNVLDLSFSRNCIQVILTKDKQVELSQIASNSFRQIKQSLSDSLSFINYFMDKNSIKLM